ncbi:hypothetical protein E4U41_007021 [Claviceps citrina]|nr:hypothetical protein E4U41_007021 [Claviceps citrina]
MTACFLSLKQLIRTIPKPLAGRATLWTLSVLAVAPYIATYWLAISTRHGEPASGERYHLDHPVELLIREAHAEFETFRTRQSRTYEAAAEAYKRRYGLDPPSGFESWYNFARMHNSAVIDDFDTMYHGLAPFWRLTGREFVHAQRRLSQLPGNELWSCDFSGPDGGAKCIHASRSFDRHVGALLDLVPQDVRRSLTNVTFFVNHLDEPRVVIPPGTSSDGARALPFHQTNLKHTPSWSKLTASCAGDKSENAADRDRGQRRPPFVSNRTAAMDLCHHDEYSSMHGLFQSPTSLAVIEGLAPVLSTGAPSTMGDILLPSPAYIESEFRYDGQADPDWPRKKNNLYWAGSTSGGHAGNQWRHFHRQRFVTLVQKLRSRWPIFHASPLFSDAAALYDVAFAKVYQCERPYCREQDMFFDVAPWAGRDEALRSRLVFDLDGNGISGRYRKLLASKSAPLKQTLLREWHDDRLVPWVHYFPVSQHMEDLPELVSFLTATERGRRRAREVAEQGREWASRALRETDMAVYVYRLMLELARLQDVERERLA